MALSLLCHKSRGTGVPTAFRVVGATVNQLGNNFARINVNTTTNFNVGDTVTASGQTAIITSVVTNTALYLNTLTGAFPGSGTLTDSTTSATATISGFEGLENAGGTNTNRHHARVIQFENRLYIFHFADVWRYNEVTSNWETIYRLSNVPVGTQTCRKSGLHVLNISGVPHMVAVHSTGGGIYRIKSSNGTSWSELNLVGAGTQLGDDGHLRSIVYQNNLYFTGNTSINGHLTWNPETDGFTTLSPSLIPNCQAGDFVVWRNKLYRLAADSNTVTNEGALLEFSTGTYLNRVRFTATGNLQGGGGSFTQNAYCAFVGPDGDLYCIYHAFTNPNAGWKCFRIQESGGVYTPTDITSSVLPSAIRWGSGGPQNGGRFEKFIDDETNALAGGPTIVYLWYATADSAGTTRTQYQWVSNSAEISQQDIGAPIEIALPHNDKGGGDRVWFTGEMDARIISKPTPIVGGERISFKIYQPTGAAPISNVRFRLLYSNKGEAPVSIGTLSNPSTGTLVGGNEIQGLTADGTTTYQVSWLAITSDGQTNFSRIVRAPVAYVP